MSTCPLIDKLDLRAPRPHVRRIRTRSGEWGWQVSDGEFDGTGRTVRAACELFKLERDFWRQSVNRDMRRTLFAA